MALAGRLVLLALAPLWLDACGSHPVYEHNTITSATGRSCDAPKGLAARYRCRGWTMLREADKAKDGGPGLRQAGSARVQVADALDSEGMKPEEAIAVVRKADAKAGLPDESESLDKNDPLEPVNRAVFRVDLALDRAVVKPAAKAYRTVVPNPVRGSVRHFYDNLHAPVTLGNALLQANWSRAKLTAGRFAVNTTLGVGGLFDPASGMGLPLYDEDFGQTLGVWGVGEGPYLVLPVLGPKPPRDAAGMVVDHFMDPLTWVMPPGNLPLSLGMRALDMVDKRSRRIETVDEMERTSLDFYATVRSLYRQRRNAEIRNQDGPEQTAPVSPGDFEFEDDTPAAPVKPGVHA